ncbi:hypothetical protein [Paenisporosarcina cavernae]|uniref:Uncharacterized protein n=1 Tax=Paenisporosarcina cavernae TaxID=2320858 RepID=A0A385YSW4_9BACL|nr:hypothetical protein [Paenisporosarcina cavernae]AYC29935.1 hypothetical protein D3873_08630 [Paenisporosarcina cavernae]
MDDKQLEQRLEFLKKSYERVPSTFQADDVIREIRAEKHQQSRAKVSKTSDRSFWQRFGVLSASVASLFIIGILAIPYLQHNEPLKQPENASVVSEEKIEDMIKIYERNRERSREKLGLSTDQFDSLSYIQEADATFEYFWKSKKILEHQMSHEEVNNQFDNLLASLRSPSEMVLHADKSVLHGSEEESLNFLLELQQKINDLMRVYNQAIAENHAIFKELQPKEGWSKPTFDKLIPSFPENIEKLTLAMKDEGITILPIQRGENFTATWHSFFPDDLVHPVTQGYVTYLDEQPYLYGGDLAKKLEEYPPLLKVFDELVLDEGGKNTDNSLYREVSSNYKNILYALVKTSNPSSLFDRNGVVKEEYQLLFKDIQQPQQHSISSYLIEPIVNEFEVSGWRNSNTWTQFNYSYLDKMFMEINYYGFKEEVYDESASNREEPVQLNVEYFQRIHSLYKKFAGTHDPAALRDISAIDLVGLYYYSQELGDMETQYELFVKDDQKFEVIPREEFLAFDHQKDSSWRKLYTSFTFQSDALENSLYPGGTVIMTLANPTNEQSEIGFRVFMTKNGWRASFMPTQ